jgi:hypothetical protein
MNRQQMTAPFAEEELRQFEGRGGKTMTYIEDETVMDRLDVGYGYGNWQVAVEPISDSVVKVRLGVRETGEWVWYEDFGYPNREGGESLKEAVSDGIRRCGRMVGIARDLYRKSTYERRPPAVGEDVPPTDAAGETLRPLGPITREGAVAKGAGRHSDLEWRETPDGSHRTGFLLEVGDGKARPQVILEGELGSAIFSTGENLLGVKVTVEGELFEVHVPKRKTIYRIHATRLHSPDWTIPADVAHQTPVEPEPPQEALPAAEEAEIDALPWEVPA